MVGWLRLKAHNWGNYKWEGVDDKASRLKKKGFERRTGKEPCAAGESRKNDRC